MSIFQRQDAPRPADGVSVPADRRAVLLRMPSSTTVGLAVRSIRRGVEPAFLAPLKVELRRLADAGDPASNAVLTWISFRKDGYASGEAAGE